MSRSRIRTLLAVPASLLGLAALLAAPSAAQPASPSLSAPLVSPSPAPMASPFDVDERLVGTWSIEAFDALGDGLVEPRRSSGLVIELRADGELDGRTGCGTYVGSFHGASQAISLDILLRAPEPCPPAISDEAVSFTDALNSVTRWRMDDPALELLDDTGEVRIRLAPRAAEGPEGAWVVSAFARPNGGLRSAPDDGSMHLTLGSDEQLTGATGCRSFQGAYMVQSDQILVVPLEIAGLPCEGAARKAEQRLLAAFERVVLWERDGATLRFTDAQGDPLVEMESAQLDGATVPPGATTAPSTTAPPDPDVTAAP